MPANEKDEAEKKILKATVDMLNDITAEHTALFASLDARLKKAVIDGSEEAAVRILGNKDLMNLYWSGAFSQFGRKAAEVGKETLWAVVWGGLKKLFLWGCVMLLVGSYFGWPFAVNILKTLVWKE